MSWELGSPAIKSASEFWLARSRLAVSANTVLPAARRNAKAR